MRNAKGSGDAFELLNMKLRDFYPDLHALCEDMDADEEEIIQKLAEIDYHYDREKNQFV